MRYIVAIMILALMCGCSTTERYSYQGDRLYDAIGLVMENDDYTSIKVECVEDGYIIEAEK